MRKVFRDIAYPYRELNLYAERIVIRRPFRCLFFLRDELKKQGESQNNLERTRDELKLLLNFIESKDGLKDTMKEFETLIPKRKITFNLLWTIFPPYAEVYHQTDHTKQLFLTEFTEFVHLPEPALAFSFFTSAHDGRMFGIQRIRFKIPAFRGTLNITKT